MKKHAIAVGMVLALVLALAACGGDEVGAEGLATAAGGAAQRVVTTTGDAEVKVAPDEVVVTLGVQTEDTQLAVAKSKNDEIVQRLLPKLKEFGITDNHIQTEYISVSPQYDYPSYSMPRLKGYSVQKTIVVTLSDLSKFEDLLSAVLDSGVNYVHSVKFQTTELRKYRDQARALAVKAAQEKAAALAGELSQQLGEPVTIIEEQSSWQSWYGYGWWGSGSGAPSQNVVSETGVSPLEAGATVAPGQISVNARVSVTFALK